MIPDFKDLAQIYQQRALESLSEEDLAHAKRYRIAAELEAVLRECREALVPYMKYVDGTNVLNHPAQCVAKIDEVLNVPDSSRTA